MPHVKIETPKKVPPAGDATGMGKDAGPSGNMSNQESGPKKVSRTEGSFKVKSVPPSATNSAP